MYSKLHYIGNSDRARRIGTMQMNKQGSEDFGPVPIYDSTLVHIQKCEEWHSDAPLQVPAPFIGLRYNDVQVVQLLVLAPVQIHRRQTAPLSGVPHQQPPADSHSQWSPSLAAAGIHPHSVESLASSRRQTAPLSGVPR